MEASDIQGLKELANLSKAFACLEALKLRLRMKPAPKPIDVSQPKAKARGRSFTVVSGTQPVQTSVGSAGHATDQHSPDKSSVV